MLINLTNHPYENWSGEQKQAAADRFGGVMDMPFPAVAACLDEDALLELAEAFVQSVLACRQQYGDEDIAVLVQGEFTLTYALVSRLMKLNIPCYAACSDREVVETVDISGITRKTAVFRFSRFRKYVSFVQ